MKSKVFIYSIYMLLITIVQGTVFDYIKVFDIKPNVIIVFIIAIALIRGNLEGAVIGFVLGFLQDVISGKVLGFYALMNMYLGLVVGSVNKRLYRENFLVIVFFTFISSVIYEGLVYMLSTFTKEGVDILFALKAYILPEAVYNSVLSIFVYVLVIKMNYKFKNMEKTTRKY